MTEMTTSETLNRAADLIEERGWGRGSKSWGFDGAPLCLEGGILAALGTDFHSIPMREWFSNCPAYAAVASYLEAPVIPTRVGTEFGDCEVWRFNDAPGRTASEVIETLRACAVIEESRERQAVSA